MLLSAICRSVPKCVLCAPTHILRYDELWTKASICKRVSYFLAPAMLFLLFYMVTFLLIVRDLCPSIPWTMS